MHAAGLKPGMYELAGRPVEMLRSGRVCLSGTPYLAGSSLMLLEGVVNAVQAGGMTWTQAGSSSSSIPARLMGVEHPSFPPKKGEKAEFLVVKIDKSRPKWKPVLECVFRDGVRL
jgi:N-acetylglucosamine-6-phosphate deacetylase